MKFVIQTVDGICRLDLCQAMQNSIDFDNWKTEHSIEDVIYCDMVDVEKYASSDYCPVGSIEFFFKYVDCLFGNHDWIKPLNVPKWAKDFSNIYVINTINDLPDIEISDSHRMFMKSTDIIKSPANGFISSKDEIIEHVQLMPEMDILSEWRIFVHNGKFVDIKNYSGNPFIFPDINVINEIEGNVPFRFEGTVDIVVTDEGKTKVLECHDFFSCGLYGFSDYNVLPSMLWRTWKKIIKK
ncbi:MAG: hypothetical protein [Wendovervirus sonii]|uniref:ATP-grasp domain-containing protein n=1 Tax=phage Lak_Megaphage_Sonny TaxID=3109229 RepID=A0ABZ0Z607_9CAUD|nr:MAG: hypothetical protein [phage Lak_Megaphage_Sonny]